MMISVIIPYHNVAAELFDMCIKSVLQQTYKDFEIVVIDDGSSEKYTKAVADVTKRDRRVRAIYQEGRGVSNARNRGVREAKGEFVVFVDADDMVTPTFLEEALAVFVNTGADLVIGGERFVSSVEEMDLCSKQVARSTMDDDLIILSGGNISSFRKNVSPTKRMRYDGGQIDRGPVVRLLRRSLALATPFHEDLAFWEDLVWNLELMDKCKTISIVKRTWYIYYQNPSSAIHRYRPHVISEMEKAISYVEKFFQLNNDDDFEVFCDYLYNNLRFIYHCYLKKSEANLSKSDLQGLHAYFYTNRPWSLFGSSRYYHLSKGKLKLLSFLFRYRVFFTGLAVRAWIKQKTDI